MPARGRLFLASSNPGKVDEFRALARAHVTSAAVEIELLPGFSSLPPFEENEPTIAENAAGKALHYSLFAGESVFADDSGLVVAALGGAPGVHSARYAGAGATSEQRIAKLLNELRGRTGQDRRAHFVCAIALAVQGHVRAVITDRVDGVILETAQGTGGFGYDPIFYFPPLKKTFAELTSTEKNEVSHRGKAFRKLVAAIEANNW